MTTTTTLPTGLSVETWSVVDELLNRFCLQQVEPYVQHGPPRSKLVAVPDGVQMPGALYVIGGASRHKAVAALLKRDPHAIADACEGFRVGTVATSASFRAEGWDLLHSAWSRETGGLFMAFQFVGPDETAPQTWLLELHCALLAFLSEIRPPHIVRAPCPTFAH